MHDKCSSEFELCSVCPPTSDMICLNIIMEVSNTACGICYGNWECLLLIGLLQFVICARVVLITLSVRDICVGKSDVCLNLATKF